ncbi:MAG: histidine phosphatase family protein [Xanthomonadales bacterium]|nr:histidine phosphatase family protein [Xanthomonadales bacterium]
MTSELFLVRHAQASFGSDDYDRLSELGHRQARWLGEHFRSRELTFDHVICGRMVRHRETAEGIFRGLGQDFDGPEQDPSWNEFDFEAIVGAYLDVHPDERPDPEASAGGFSRLLRNALHAWTEDRLPAPLPERWRQFEGSGGAIATALSHVLQAPPSAMVQMNLQLRNSSVSHLYFSRRAVYFSGFNHVPHLDQPDRAGSVTYY